MVKQVICVRKDLHMRQGKTAAQCSHASMKVILDLMLKTDYGKASAWTLHMFPKDPIYQWLTGLFTKIVVYVNSEKELLEVYGQAKDSGILCALIEDSGKTEFGGKPTYTCCAIGPDESENIDKITGELPLL